VKLTKERRRVEGTAHDRVFDYVGHTGWGFSFACQADGTIKGPLHPAAAENLAACLAGTNGTIDRGVRSYAYAYTVPAEGRCTCGAIVVLDGDTRGEGIDCDRCGRIYNSGGQELAPRSQWDDSPGWDGEI
jgi:hypothetical protein